MADDIVTRLREALDAVQNFRGDLDSDEFNDAQARLRFSATIAAPCLLDEIERLRAALAQQAPQAVPTKAQKLAGARAWMEAVADPDMSPADKAGHVYRAMGGAPAAPAGWQVVPVEPTEAMELDGMRALRSTPRTATGASSREQAWACYRAMLAATPPAPAQES